MKKDADKILINYSLALKQKAVNSTNNNIYNQNQNYKIHEKKIYEKKASLINDLELRFKNDDIQFCLVARELKL